MGCFITFEGIEGCGKTTQIRMAGEFLKKKGIPVVVTEEPGGTGLGRELRRLLLSRASFDLCGEAELFLFLADRAQHVRERIRPALERNQWVLCDRFSDATIAYQGFGRGLDRKFIHRLTAFSAGFLEPDLTLLFDLSAETGIRRALQRASGITDAPVEDRFEREAMEFHERVREGYLTISREEPGRVRVLDGSKGIPDVRRDVCFHLTELMERKGC